MLWTLKDFAREMDCHPVTARRWVKKLRVPADVVGHGADKWRERTARKFLKLWSDFYKARGTTFQITRSKYLGSFEDIMQFHLTL